MLHLKVGQTSHKDANGSHCNKLPTTLRDDGAAVIVGTTVKVAELVAQVQAYGWSPEELHFEHPDLSLGQIHSALAYCWDHKDARDLDLAQTLREADERRAAAGPSAVSARLRPRGHP